MAKVWDYKSNDNDKLAEKVEKDRTIVMTKPSMAQYLVNRITFEPDDTACEPCKGDGAFLDAIPCQKVWFEINEDKDYLTSNTVVDYTISNPPFVPRKLFWSFQQKAMATTRKKIYWLINLTSMNVFTPKRLEEMKEAGWYIQSQHIVADKRWFGRYCFIEIGKKDNGYYTWKNGAPF